MKKKTIVLEEQEVPLFRKALERAEASLQRQQQQQHSPGNDDDNDDDAPSSSCGCRHLWQVLPHQLELKFCQSVVTTTTTTTTSSSSRSFSSKNNSTAAAAAASTVLHLQNPVHALHFTSQLSGPDQSQQDQGLLGIPVPNHTTTGNTSTTTTTSATNNNNNHANKKMDPQLLALTMLYGEEQERALAIRTPGLLELWHDGVHHHHHHTTSAPMDIDKKDTTTTTTMLENNKFGATRTSSGGIMDKDTRPRPTTSNNNNNNNAQENMPTAGTVAPRMEMDTSCEIKTPAIMEMKNKDSSITVTLPMDKSTEETEQKAATLAINTAMDIQEDTENKPTTEQTMEIETSTTTTTTTATKEMDRDMERQPSVSLPMQTTEAIEQNFTTEATTTTTTTPMEIVKDTEKKLVTAETDLLLANPVQQSTTKTASNTDDSQKETTKADSTPTTKDTSRAVTTTTVSSRKDVPKTETNMSVDAFVSANIKPESKPGADISTASTSVTKTEITATTVPSMPCAPAAAAATVEPSVTNPTTDGITSTAKFTAAMGSNTSTFTTRNPSPSTKDDSASAPVESPVGQPTAAAPVTADPSTILHATTDGKTSSSSTTTTVKGTEVNTTSPRSTSMDPPPTTKTSSTAIQHNHPPQSPNTLADPVAFLHQKAITMSGAPPFTSKILTHTPLPPPPNPFLLPESQFFAYHDKEEQIKALRRAVLAKRTIASTTSKKSKGGTASGNKKRKVNSSNNKESFLPSHHGLNDAWISKPTIPSLTKAQQEAYVEKMEHATLQVELWMEHFRLARKTYWRGKRNEAIVAMKRRRQDVPWGTLGSSTGTTPCSEVPMCRQCDPRLGPSKKERTLVQCLECHFIGCLCPKSKSGVTAHNKESQGHLLEHMALSGHHLGVTLEPGARVYCFDCDGFVRHEVFDQEMLRLDLGEKLSWLGWTEQPIVRSFDAMRFIQIPDVGIFWNGMVAAYPTTIPHYHWEASQRCHKRYFSFAGQDDYLLPPVSASVLKFAKLQKSLEAARRFKISKPVGMYNLGDTCFQSAVFQCLLNCSPVQDYFLKVGHNHAACPLYPREKTAKAQTEKQKLAAQVCLACEFDKMILNYYASSVGFRVSAALSSPSPLATVTKTPETASQHNNGNMTQPLGEAIIASDMLAATWKCKDLSHLAGYAQHDAHEFLHGFLDVVQKHIQKYRKSVATAVAKGAWGALKTPTERRVDPTSMSGDIIRNLFEGKLRSVLLCTECGEKRKQSESFLSISLPLSKEVHKATEGRPGESTDGQGRFGKSKLSIERQLRHFTLPESLSDPVHCPACKKKTLTLKQHVVSRLPKILCLHLKRFDDKKKINDFVSFPLRSLNMGNLLPHFCEVTRFDENGYQRTCTSHDPNSTIEAELLYDLFATVNHFGTLQSGHYVANVMVENDWYHCNDAHVSRISADDVLKSDAYLLFYTRR